MNKSDAAQRIVKLREIISEYRYHYHVLDESTMSEAAADSLKHELAQLESQYPELITNDSPTQRVAGAPLPGFVQVAHSSRMLSLNDVFDVSELTAWQERITKLLPENTKLEYFADIKMDGLACALVYEDGLLQRGITRGDGFVGEDVTANIRTIESLPLRLRSSPGLEQFLQGRTEVRGEIVMYKADFTALNEARATASKPLFANPRNTAAGTIRQLDPALVAERTLHFRAYDIFRDNSEEIATNAFAYKTMQSLGFLANKDATVFGNLTAVMQFADTWDSKRAELEFNTDGLVIKVNNRNLYRRLGVVGKAPRGAVALKYAAEQATTVVKDIFISIGRTGAATPVAMLEPVVIAGSTVQMATLHNEAEIIRKDIRVGDTVIVHKAGDIIPEIIEPLVSLRSGTEQQFMMPTHCPDCNTKLAKYNQNDAAWRCLNEACPSRAYKRIEHFASKSAMDIDGLGEKNIIALLNAKLAKDASDIYTLTFDNVVKLDRFADVSAHKLIAAIQIKKEPALHRFIYGLGIRHVGTQTAIDLANHFKTLEALSQATIDELAGIDGIGVVVAESLIKWFSEPVNTTMLQKFETYGLQPQPVNNGGGPLAGSKFVVTGSLHTMGREEAAEHIRVVGGAFQSSLTKDTDYLVVGDNVGAVKLAKADKLGTKLLTETEFIALLEH